MGKRKHKTKIVEKTIVFNRHKKTIIYSAKCGDEIIHVYADEKNEGNSYSSVIQYQDGHVSIGAWLQPCVDDAIKSAIKRLDENKAYNKSLIFDQKPNARAIKSHWLRGQKAEYEIAPTHNGLERFGRRYSIEEVIPFIVATRVDIKRDYDGDLIRLTSSRLLCFKEKGVVCVNCEVRGEFFAKERWKGSKRLHFNLYAVKLGVEILMTRDHIIPLSRGGLDHISNYQTMCKICNEKKGSDIILK